MNPPFGVPPHAFYGYPPHPQQHPLQHSVGPFPPPPHPFPSPPPVSVSVSASSTAPLLHAPPRTSASVSASAPSSSTSANSATSASSPSSSSAASSSSPSSAASFLGATLSLVSVQHLRYEGVLFTLNPENSTLVLKDVRFFGTENRPAAQFVPPADEVYEYIVVNAKDVLELRVVESKPTQPPPPPQPFAHFHDPAIISAGPAAFAPNYPPHQAPHLPPPAHGYAPLPHTQPPPGGLMFHPAGPFAHPPYQHPPMAGPFPPHPQLPMFPPTAAANGAVESLDDNLEVGDEPDELHEKPAATPLPPQKPQAAVTTASPKTAPATAVPAASTAPAAKSTAAAPTKAEDNTAAGPKAPLSYAAAASNKPTASSSSGASATTITGSGSTATAPAPTPAVNEDLLSPAKRAALKSNVKGAVKTFEELATKSSAPQSTPPKGSTVSVPATAATAAATTASAPLVAAPAPASAPLVAAAAPVETKTALAEEHSRSENGSRKTPSHPRQALNKPAQEEANVQHTADRSNARPPRQQRPPRDQQQQPQIYRQQRGPRQPHDQHTRQQHPPHRLGGHHQHQHPHPHPHPHQPHQGAPHRPAHQHRANGPQQNAAFSQVSATDLNSEFDFTASNAKFTKLHSNEEDAPPAVPQVSLPVADDKKDPPADAAAEDGNEGPQIGKKYDKARSFYDAISRGNESRDDRQKNVETFGVDANRPHAHHQQHTHTQPHHRYQHNQQQQQHRPQQQRGQQRPHNPGNSAGSGSGLAAAQPPKTKQYRPKQKPDVNAGSSTEQKH